MSVLGCSRVSSSVDLGSDFDDNDTTYFPLGTSERLRSEINARRAQLTRIAQEKQREEETECTFHPRINSNAQKVTVPAWDRLTRNNQKVLLPEGAAHEAAQLEECTFQPRINQISRAMASSRAQNKSVSEKRSCGSPHGDAAAECTFSPKINFGYRSSSPRQAIEKRVPEILRAREEKKFARALEVDNGCTFSPLINQKSAVLATMKENSDENLVTPGRPATESSDHSSRVKQYDDALRQKQEHDMRAHILRTQELMQACTFRPAIDASSRKIAGENPLYKSAFSTRQKLYSVRKQSRITANMSEPNTAAKRLDPHLVWEQIQRLHSIGPDRNKAVKEELRRASQQITCPFQPCISERSKELAQNLSRPRPPLSEPKTPVAHHCQEEAETVPAKTQGSPDMNNLSSATHKSSVKRSASVQAFYDHQRQIQEEHDQRVEELQRMKAVEELSECTFAPTIARRRSSSVPNHKAATRAKGLNDFYARQKKAQQMKREKQERSESLGKGMECNGPNFTLIRPFQLQTALLPRARKADIDISVLQESCRASTPAGVAHLVRQLVGKA